MGGLDGDVIKQKRVLAMFNTEAQQQQQQQEKN